MQATLDDFKRYRNIKKEVARLRRQIARLEQQGKQAEVVVKGSGGYPYVARPRRVVGLVCNGPRIEAKKDELQEYVEEAGRLWRRLEVFLDGLGDNVLRETLELYYIDGVAYGDVAECLGEMGHPSTPHLRVQRFFEKCR